MRHKFLKTPYVRCLEGLKDDIQNVETVGKTTEVTEIIKLEAVAETLMTFQSSHRPNDLWHYVIKSTHRDPDSVEFFYYINWVDKKLLPMKTQYFNQKEIVYRTYTEVKVDEIDGYTTATAIQMKDQLAGGKTIVDFSSIKYTLGLPVNIFTERFLRRPPKKYMN